MKWLMAVLILIGFVNAGVAEEFKLEFSKDFVETDAQQLDESASPPVKAAPAVDKPLPTTAAPAKTTDVKGSELEGKQPNQDVQPQLPERLKSSPHTPRYNQTSTLKGAGLIPDDTVNFLGQGLSEVSPSQQLISIQGQNGDDPFAQIRDDLRVIVGEDVYAKMVWSYWDLKELDNLIYSKMSQYDLLVQEWFASAEDILGLNDQLRAELVLSGSTDAEVSRLRSAYLNNPHVQLQQRLSASLASDKLNQALVTATAEDLEKHSLFFKLLKYMTIKNFFYLILSIAGSIYIAKMFKFLVRQQ